MKEWLENARVVSLLMAFSFALGLLFLVLSKHVFQDEILVTVSGLLGAYLTISVIVNLFHKWILKPSEDLNKRNEIEALISNKIDFLIENSKKYGFEGLIEQIDYQLIFNNLGKGDTLWWLDTFAPGHTLWEENVRQALKRGASIKMLVLSPEADFLIENRANEIGGKFTPVRFKSDIERFIESMEHILNESAGDKGNLEIRLYNDLLAMPMYIISKDGKPKEAYSSFYLTAATAVNFPHLKWKAGDGAAIQSLYQYIQFKWSNNA